MADKKRVIALGFFDGIHIGHAALLKKALEISVATGLTPSVITFDTHPLGIVGGKDVQLINSPEDRAGLIHRVFGIDDIILLHFDKVTSSMPWEVFIDHLANDFNARHLIAGHDFRFGSGGSGNSSLLKRKCNETGIGCDVIPEVKYNRETVSSTNIRDLISGGNIEKANKMLGHPHVLTDVVHYGYKLGRTLGTPTINMSFPDNVVIPAYGVYATKVHIHSDMELSGNTGGDPGHAFIRTGVTNIGVRPTVDNSGRITAETHILDFSGNLYGRKVRIEFHSFLRPEVKYDDITGLKAQIQQDCESARRYFL